MNMRTSMRRVLAGITLTCAFAGSATAGASSLVPKSNAVWAYDPPDASGQIQIGAFVDAINYYNLAAQANHKISEVYTYGGDMEMYCPGGVISACTGSDLYVFYSRTQPVPGQKDSNASTFAYHQGVEADLLNSPILIAPIIDGTVTGSGPLAGFNDLSKRNANYFADKVAHRICDDPYAAGVELDLEPFNVETPNAQYYFYLRLARDLVVGQTGCVNSAYPKGRFFAIFAGANAINPATPSAGRVAEILTKYHDGYLINPLYDLASTPPGYRTGIDEYARLVDAQTYNTAHWASGLGIEYQFDIPAAASFHDYATCTGPACAGAAAPAAGQLAYVETAEAAIDESGARSSPLYLGTAVWALTGGIHYGQTTFGPQNLTDTMDRYLAGML